MKKIIAVLLVLVMCFALCACSNSSKVEKLETAINGAIMDSAYAECFHKYENVKGIHPTVTTIDENNDGTYSVYGKIMVNDVYNDKYEGKFEAIVSIDNTGEAHCTDFYLETPQRMN